MATDNRSAIPDAEPETPRQIYEGIRETYRVDERNDLETFVDAVEGSATILEIQRELREQRPAIKAALRKLGLADSHEHYPPDDLDQRLETLREGEIPRGDQR